MDRHSEEGSHKAHWWTNLSLHVWTNIGVANAVLIGFAVILIHGDNWTVAITAFGASMGLGGVLGFLFGIPGLPRGIEHVDNLAVGGQGASVSAGDTAAPLNASHPAASVQPHVAPTAAAASEAPMPPANPVPLNPTRPRLRSLGATPPPSNLEQVADWVTKLLLGGGLTQLQHIPPKVWQWSRALAIGIAHIDPQASPAAAEQYLQAQQAFAAGLLTYGFVLGFFAGFLITKLSLGRAVVR